MNIQDANISMGASHYFAESLSVKESLRLWTTKPGTDPAQHSSDIEISSTLNTSTVYSDDQKLRKARKTKDSEDDYLEGNPNARIIKSLMEKIFGHKIKLSIMPRMDSDQAQQTAQNLQDATAPQRQGWGMDYQYQEQRQESESVSFQAKGSIKTSDGQEFQFELQFELQRNYLEENSLSLHAGDAPVDPLVLNFDGPAATLSSDRFSFDLNSDGKNESLAQLKKGSAFLALDRNQDGKINNGSEMFKVDTSIYLNPKTGPGTLQQINLMV